MLPENDFKKHVLVGNKKNKKMRGLPEIQVKDAGL